MVTELITTDSGKTKSSPKSLKGAMKVIKKLKGRIGLGESSYFLYFFWVVVSFLLYLYYFAREKYVRFPGELVSSYHFFF